MKKRTVIVLIVVAVAIIIGAVIWLIPPSAPVATAQEREVVETLVATGQVIPQSRTSLIADVPGVVNAVHLEEGDAVSQGEVLFELDDQEARAALTQAEAAVSEARARLRSVTDQGAPSAVEDLNQAMLNLEAAVEDFERAQGLFDAGVIPRVEVDEARRRVERAEGDADRARTAVEETTASGSTYDEAAAAVQRAQSERERAQIQLEEFTIRAPADGEMLSRDVEPGTTVQPGTPLASLAIDGPLHIQISPDEQELAHLSVGQSAHVVTDAFPERQFPARVHRINPSVDPERGTITVELRIDDAPEFIRIDMTATAEIELDRKEDALVLPRAALRDTADRPWVLRYEDGRARRVDVEVGLQDDRFAEITSGLEPFDEVLIDPELQPDQRVRRGDHYLPIEDEDRE